MDSDDELEWDDVEQHAGDIQITLGGAPRRPMAGACLQPGATGRGSALPAPLLAAGPEKPKAPARRAPTREEKERAKLLHQSHALCLLARGSLMDAAACDPELQVRRRRA